MENKKIIQLILNLGFSFVKALKTHTEKRYTFLVTKNGCYFIAKIHTLNYIKEQSEKHFGIDILSKPSSDIFSKNTLKTQNLVIREFFENYCISIYEYILGESLEDILINDESKFIDQYIEKLTSLFYQYNKVNLNTDKFGTVASSNGNFASWFDFVKIYFYEKINFALKQNLIYSSDAKQLQSLLLQSDLFTNVCSVIHYDLSTSNIIVDEDDELVVIDWDGYYIGDFVYSITKFLYYLHTNDFHSSFAKLKSLVDDKFGKTKIDTYLLLVTLEKIIVVAKQNYNKRFLNDKSLFFKLKQQIKGKFFFIQNPVILMLTTKFSYSIVKSIIWKLKAVENSTYFLLFVKGGVMT